MFPYGLEGERLIDFLDAAPVFNELAEELEKWVKVFH